MSLGNLSSTSNVSNSARFQVSKSPILSSSSCAMVTSSRSKKIYSVSVTPCNAHSSTHSSSEEIPKSLSFDKISNNRKKKQFKIVRISCNSKSSIFDNIDLNNFISDSGENNWVDPDFDPLIDIF